MKGEIICECRNVVKSYGHNEVLRNCNLQVPRNAMTGLVGENGSGKTTLVRCLLGFTNPDAGTIDINEKTGYCPQEQIMNRGFTVNEHLMFTRSIYEQHCSVDMEYLQHLIEVFRLTEHLDKLISELSGGTRQKVQFISSIMHRPVLLLMDEPYGGFDWDMYLAFWDVVVDLCKNGTGILLITHFVYDRDRFDRLYHLKNGVLYEDT